LQSEIPNKYFISKILKMQSFSSNLNCKKDLVPGIGNVLDPKKDIGIQKNKKTPF
jgi:hypothetical protein